jgi:hypothetical protein
VPITEGTLCSIATMISFPAGTEGTITIIHKYLTLVCLDAALSFVNAKLAYDYTLAVNYHNNTRIQDNI